MFSIIWNFIIKYPLLIIGVIVILAIVGIIVHLENKIGQLQSTLVSISNVLADTDSLHRVLIVKTEVLYERYVRQEKDLEKVAKNSEILKEYLEEKSSEIQFLAHSITQVQIQNQKIAGILQKDSLGEDFVVFNKTDSWYSLQAITNISSEPYLLIKELSIVDSSFVGYVKNSNGLYEGFITHANPYITEKNADFKIPLPEYQNNSNGLKLDWYWTPVALGVGILVGKSF